MKRGEALRLLGEQAADQWGLVTAAQARVQGVDQVTLLRLCDAGLLTNVGRGVYLVTGAAPPEHLDIRVAWLRLDPERPAWERRKPEADNGVVSHRSACLLFELGDIPAPEVELTVPRRRTTRQPGVRLHRGALTPSDVTVVDGLPVTTVERTIVDLLQTHADGGHVGGVIADAEHRGMLDLDRLAERVAPFGAAYGMPRASGAELLRALVSQAGGRLHSDELQRTVDTAALAGFLAGLGPSPAMKAAMDALAASALSPIGESVRRAMVPPEVLESLRKPLIPPEVLKTFQQPLISPETLAAVLRAVSVPAPAQETDVTEETP